MRIIPAISPRQLESAVPVSYTHLGPSVIISRRPCALLKSVKHEPSFAINTDACIGCKACLAIGCPAISIKNKKAVIDHTQCVGCGVCKTLCPKKAILTGEEAKA